MDINKVLTNTQNVYSYFDFAHSGGGGGQPSLSLPVAAVLLSGQQPNSVSSQCVGGHPSKFFPVAGETPSSQQPNLVSLQVLVTGHPLSNGPSAGVILSIQQPYFVFLQSFLFLFLQTLGFSVWNISVIGVEPHSSVPKTKISILSPLV